MIDLEFLQSWTGGRETAVDRIDPHRVRQLAASFDLDDGCLREGDALPPLWHWLFATPVAALGEAGHDGHTARGGFLPPIPLPRRMWAGSRVRWEAQLPIGQAIERHSRVLEVKPKEGKTGPLVFVSVEHQWHCASRLALVEEQDIVYRALPESAAPDPALPAREAPKTAAPEPIVSRASKVWTSTLEDAARLGSIPGGEDGVECTVRPNEVLLFRYSALTFNSHRIHYDRRHCLEAEKYPGLVVHGPLLATMMVTLAWYQEKRRFPSRLAFRAIAPVFDGEVIRVRAIRAGRFDPGSALEPFALKPFAPKPFALEPFAPERSTDCTVVRADGSVAMTAQLAW
jgi:3-methylfumaryl-CoA hydratase